MGDIQRAGRSHGGSPHKAYWYCSGDRPDLGLWCLTGRRPFFVGHALCVQLIKVLPWHKKKLIA
ncbi:hypothetical protein UCMB321_1588 [Pseudomonas batumici]|uniref:Uncharacterized protein n=1 Tax=Pseudomonas batumici TaxID=226910 RepID=A0A0C2F0T4_9PSED|nr:hypothetical protein UCMB321_1588 [Pseudomonas batumici]